MAVARGFLDPEASEEEHAEVLPDLAARRTVEVDSAAEPAGPSHRRPFRVAPLALRL